jgi:hypothetical protein
MKRRSLSSRLHRGLWGVLWEAVGFLVVLAVLKALGVL